MTKIAAYLGFIALWALAAPASITLAATDASRASGDRTAAVGAKVSALEKLATGEMAKFVPAEEPAPVSAIEFADLAGDPVTLEQFRGRVLVVNFWATWCAPCRRELPSLERLQRLIGGDDLAVLAVSIDRSGADKVNPFLERFPLPRLGVYLDPNNKLGRAFGTFGLPTTVLVDRDGLEVGRLVGPAEWDSAESLALVRHLIGGTESSRAAK
jgi:thiol-disulfide isomerase/thioredoxin